MEETGELKYSGNHYEGIGGWLILVAIRIVTTPIQLIIAISQILSSFSAESLAFLTTPGTEGYHPLWLPLVIFETVTNIVFLAFSILLPVLFFKKKARFPRLMIFSLLLILSFW